MLCEREGGREWNNSDVTRMHSSHKVGEFPVYFCILMMQIPY